MTRHQKQTPLLLLGITILAIILLSSGLSELKFQSGRSLNILEKLGELRSDPGPGLSLGAFPIEVFTLVFWSSLVFALIFAIVSPRYRKLLLRTFITMLLLLFAFSLLRPIQPDTIIEDEEETAQMDEAVLGQNAGDSPETPDFVSDPPHWFMMVVNVVVALLLAAAFWLLWRFMRARDDDTQTLLVQQAEIALSDLTAGGDLKDVIMRCYASMSQVLYQSRNIQRDEAMTPREFEIHLAEIGLQDRHIQRLTRLFESVRYGASSPGELAQREALDCLRAIARAWGAS
jgi:type II secretory pathway component PulM